MDRKASRGGRNGHDPANNVKLSDTLKSVKKCSVELTVRSVEITNIVKAPAFCGKNDLIRLVVLFNETPVSDAHLDKAVSKQFISSYAQISKSPNTHVVTLAWNQSFQMESSGLLHLDDNNAPLSSIAIQLFSDKRDGNRDASEKGNSLPRPARQEQLLAECDLLALNEVCSTIKENATTNG